MNKWKLQVDWSRTCGLIWILESENKAIQMAMELMKVGIQTRTKSGNLNIIPPSRFQRITIKMVKA